MKRLAIAGIFVLVAMGMLFGTGVGVASAETLYGLTFYKSGCQPLPGGDCHAFISIDSETGAGSFIGYLDTFMLPFGLGDYNGHIYTFDQQADLVRELDSATGHTVASIDVGLRLFGEGSIAFRSDGLGFVTENYGSYGEMWSFDIARRTSRHIGIDMTIDGADFDAGNCLYGLSQRTADLYLINQATGAVTLVGPTGIVDTSPPGMAVGGLTFGSDGTLYAAVDEWLYSVDTCTAEASFIGDIGFTLMSGLTAITSPMVPAVRIGEIRVDQPDTDYDEYFELSGPPGTYLDGMTYVVIGSGAGGSGVIHEAVDLTGSVMPAGGHFVAAESTFSLGTANLTVDLKFDNDDNVTHMLVRDFAGYIGLDLDGDDDGLLDTEPWSEVMDSVALIGPPGSGGQVYSPAVVGPDGSFVPAHVFLCHDGWWIGDFTILDDTPGAHNCPSPPDSIVINEILQNPSPDSDCAGEWFELYNTTGMDIDMNGWTIADNDCDIHVINNGGPLVIPAHGYLVLGNNGDTGTNGGVNIDYQYANTFLGNGADEIFLYDYLGKEMDRVAYDGGATFPDPTGAAMALADPALDNNIGAKWCVASTPFGDGDLGTPGAQNDLCPPDADAGGPYTVNEGDAAQLDASGTTAPAQAPETLMYEWDLDNDGDFDDASGMTTVFSAVHMDGPGALTIGLRVTDNKGASDVDTATVTIRNVAPTADAGPDQIVSPHETITVTGSWTDPAGLLDEPYAWAWDIDGDGVFDLSGVASYGDTITIDTDYVGQSAMTFKITDKDGGQSSDTLTIEVNNQPPDCEDAYPSTDTLWPPNHAFVAIDILGVTDEDGDPVTITIESITQDEPEDGPGDGSFAPDSRGVGSSTAELRAERDGSGDGREYIIRFTATDDPGDECSGEVTVAVPLSRKK